MMPRNREGLAISLLALFTTMGALVCCALPILLVSLGLGSVVAAVTLKLPVLVTLSEYKTVMFSAAAVLLALSALFIWNGKACPADPQIAVQCRRAKRVGKNIFLIAIVLWTIGLFFAWLLLPLRLWLDV